MDQEIETVGDGKILTKEQRFGIINSVILKLPAMMFDTSVEITSKPGYELINNGEFEGGGNIRRFRKCRWCLQKSLRYN